MMLQMQKIKPNIGNITYLEECLENDYDFFLPLRYSTLFNIQIIPL